MLPTTAVFSVEVDHPALVYLVDGRRVDVRRRPFYSPFHHALHGLFDCLTNRCLSVYLSAL